VGDEGGVLLLENGMNWELIADVYAAGSTIVCLWNVEKHKNWWLVYALGTGVFTGLMIYKGLPGMTMMGICLIITALKNYKQK